VASREGVRRALTDLGWEVKTEGGAPEAVVGAYGKYHVMVSFEGGDPTSVIISYVGRGGGMLSRKWPGVEHLPTPQKVVRALS
jgi:hypothetical protein